MNKTIPISKQEAVAHECDYRAREVRDMLHGWQGMSDSVKRAIMADVETTLLQASEALRPTPPSD